MKPRLLFVTLHMPLGGIERSLLDVFSVIPMDRYDVTLLLRDKEGKFLAEVPPAVRVVELPLGALDRYEARHVRVKALCHFLLTGHWLHAARMLARRLRWTLAGREGDYDAISIEAILKRTPRCLSEKFDVAIAYFGDDLWSVCIVRSYVDAVRRYSWSHIEDPVFQKNLWLYEHVYRAFDGRFACSRANAECINRALGVPGAVRYFPYVVDVARMKRLAGQGKGLQRGAGLNVLTVGRLCRQKGIDTAIRVHKRLLDSGIPHCWHVVGEGAEEPALRAEIAKNHVQDSFLLLGGTSNPYPFFASCDVYAQPSRFEGYCLTVAEARAFGRPIVCTDFAGAKEQLKDGKTGLIVPVEDENAFFVAMSRLLRDASLRASLSSALLKEQVDTQSQARRLWLHLLEGK